MRAAIASDFPFVRELIVNAAVEGSFDPALAEPTAPAELFFAGLSRVIQERVWLRPFADKPLTLAIPATVWIYENPAWSQGPVGFFALRSAGPLGQELWLAAIRPECRGQGIGKQMVTELLAMPAGRNVAVVQCDKHAIGARRLAAIMLGAGFECVREGKQTQWLASRALPEPLKRSIILAGQVPST